MYDRYGTGEDIVVRWMYICFENFYGCNFDWEIICFEPDFEQWLLQRQFSGEGEIDFTYGALLGRKVNARTGA